MKNRSKCIKIVGVGGCGCSTVAAIQAKMAGSLGESFQFVGMDTDFHNLDKQDIEVKVEIGEEGEGTGKDPGIGMRAAQYSKDKIDSILKGAEFVILCAGLGGGTGSGATPTIAQQARQIEGCTVLAVTTLPSNCEDMKKHDTATQALLRIREVVPAVFPVRNGEGLPEGISYLDSMRSTDKSAEMLIGLIETMENRVGQPNLDFKEFRRAVSEQGSAVLCYGSCAKDEKLSVAIQQALSERRCSGDTDFRKAKMAVCVIKGDTGLSHKDYQDGIMNLSNEIGNDKPVCQGVYLSKDINEKSVYVMITGMEEQEVSLPPVEPATDGIQGEQYSLDFFDSDQGRFKGVQPTFIAGINYDKPTFQRHNVRLRGNYS